MSDPVVYYVQMPRGSRGGGIHAIRDLSPANIFGQLRPILPPTASPFRPDAAIADIRQSMAGFTSDDYLLAIGNPILIGLCTAVAAERTGGLFRMLQWHGIDRRYIVIPIDTRVKK